MASFKKLKGRPLELNQEVIDKVCKHLVAGAYVETAVVMAGIGKTTFYRLMKESHKAERELEEINAERKEKKLKPKKLSEGDQLKVNFRNAVSKAMEESTMRDLLNIDKSAMGRKPVFDRYPPRSKENPNGTWIPARNDKGEVQFNDRTGEVIMIEVSGQIVTDFKGKPIIADHGAPPDWRASAWRLEKRDPKKWGDTKTFVMERRDPIENPDDEESDDINIIFVEPKEVE